MALSTFTFASSHVLRSVSQDAQRPSFLSSQWLMGADLQNPFQQNFNQVKKRSFGVLASLSEAGEYYSQRPPTPLLDTVNYPIHMKNLSIKELKQLADELRSDTIFNVSKTGGHLGSSLGVVELTVALHYVFNAPQDKIIWDVGHQTYPHKILTGRRDKMPTLRQTNGLAGFTKRSESEYDSFGAGHSSTSISAALGMAVGRDLKGRKNNVVAVIGDGAMTAGQAYEAMNNAGYLDSDMIVILNDNKQVSLPTATLDGPIPPVGALSSALSRLQSSRPLRELREVAKGVTKQIGGPVHELAAKVDEYTRGMISGSGSSLFEELGLYYIGPVDGHNIDDLLAILKEVKSTKSTGPVLIHVVTEKGRGYPYAEKAADKYHGVTKFDPATGKQYPRGNGIGVQLPPGNKGIPLEVGKGRILIEGERVALLGYGSAVQNCLAAASLMAKHGITITVADARFCKPLDQALVRSLAKHHEVLITIEEASIGGFSSHVAQFLALDGLLDGKLKFQERLNIYCKEGDLSYGWHGHEGKGDPRVCLRQACQSNAQGSWYSYPGPVGLELDRAPASTQGA
ncbi:hypothetical protein Scep_009154 [Stephania cephalantha]|uniref:Transketolase C-terminal domain-containing protein n=1 Tax=Stephania cephalantha TaxID=152367 RepID=A0AAP0JU18_9MAGN